MNTGAFEIGSAVRSADGHREGGDAVVCRQFDESVMVAVVDVLGHGPDAHEVATRAAELLEAVRLSDPVRVLGLLDAELAGTLGAAVGLATVSRADGAGRFVGVGNTVARIVGRTERSMVSVDGVVGRRHPGVRPVEFVLEPGGLLLMHSDGVTSRFAVDDYPSLRAEDAAVIPRELIRRFGKNHDDAACIALRRMG